VEKVAVEYPEKSDKNTSHETIYRSLFVRARGVLKKKMLRHLRSKRTIRRSMRADPNGNRREQIRDLVSIRERPAAVEDRPVPGHWQGDLDGAGYASQSRSARRAALRCRLIAFSQCGSVA
jgi:IS30 family transposase